VFDLDVLTNHNFVANDTVVHNCTEKGAQQFFANAKPKSITDIAALTSIYRPGPLAADVDKIYNEARAEGMPKTKELWAEYIATRLPSEGYGDWYRRTKLLVGTPLPGPDWVGWHPQVDLEDIKLKVIQNLGEDMHDYDLWPERARRLLNKPFINAKTIKPILKPPEMTEEETITRINKLFLVNKMRPGIYSSTSFGKSRGSIRVDIEQESNLAAIMEDLN